MNRRISPVVCTMVFVSLLCGSVAKAQTTWYVDDDAPNDPGPGDPTVSDPLEDGTAGHPFDAIQEAIDAAAEGHEVLVLDGTYTGVGNRYIYFHGKAISVHSESGNPETCVIDCEGLARGVGFMSGEGPDSVLEGVTVRNGYSGTHGAGVWCDEYSSPTITNCVFSGNVAEWAGAGFYCFLCSDPTITNCVFSGNSAGTDGGGLGCHLSSPILYSCTFAGNSAGSEAGGIHCMGNGPYLANPTLIGCTLYGNSAPQGSGLSCDSDSYPTLENTIVSFGLGGEGVRSSNATLTCCDVFGNEGGDWVGGIADQYGVNGNISEHPLFCDPGGADFTLQPSSPCAPFTPPNEECDLIGAWPVGCENSEYVCCNEDDCDITSEESCLAAGGEWLPGVESCDPNPCISYACCLGEECQMLFEEDCTSVGGVWMGMGITCEPNPCLMETYVVRPDGTGDFPTIQAAIDAVPDRTIIELTDGTFTGAGNRDVDFRGKAVTVRSQSGNPDTCIVDCKGSEADPHIAFYFQSGEGSDSVLKGVTVINGCSDWFYMIGIYVHGANPTITSNVFIDNGIAFGGNVTGARVLGNVFRDFSAGSEQSAISVVGMVIIRGNTFRDFFGDLPWAGAIEVWGTGSAVNTAIVEENLFENIGAYAISLGGTGGAIISGEIHRNVFAACGALNSSPAISIGGTGGVTIHSWVSGNVIANCYGPGIEIGGISSSEQYGEFINNTVVGNLIGISKGGNVYYLQILNTILWNNGDDLVNVEESEIGWSDISDGDFSGLNGNISEDPLFVDPDNTDYHLMPLSPCIDTGDPDSDYTGQTDIDGQVRVWDGDDDDVPVVDMGADEFGSFVYGDLNCDGVLDGLDVGPFVLALIDPGAYAAAYPACDAGNADCNGDGLTDVNDVQPFVQVLLDG